MFPKRVIPLLILALLTMACDQPQPKPSASSGAKAKPSASSADTKPSTPASATVEAKAPSKASASAVPETASSAVALTTASVAPTASAVASAVPTGPPTRNPTQDPVFDKRTENEAYWIRNIPNPTGVNFVPRRKWLARSDDGDILNPTRLVDADNPEDDDDMPKRFFVLTHTGSRVATVDNELKILRQDRRFHMAPKNMVRRGGKDHFTGMGYREISYHYIIGPSGKIYQGRSIWHPTPQDAKAGDGMERHDHQFEKCFVALLGNFSSSDQEFTQEAQDALVAFAHDREGRFNWMFSFYYEQEYNRLKSGNVSPKHYIGTDRTQFRIRYIKGEHRTVIDELLWPKDGVEILEGKKVRLKHKIPFTLKTGQ